MNTVGIWCDPANVGTSNWIEPIHNKGTNFLWADGHVSWQSYLKLDTSATGWWELLQ